MVKISPRGRNEDGEADSLKSGHAIWSEFISMTQSRGEGLGGVSTFADYERKMVVLE